MLLISGFGNSFLKIIGVIIYVIIVIKISVLDICELIILIFLLIVVVVIMSDKVDVKRKFDVKMVFILYYFFKINIGISLDINNVMNNKGINISIFLLLNND